MNTEAEKTDLSSNLIWEEPQVEEPQAPIFNLHSTDSEDDKIVIKYAHMAGGTSMQPFGALRNIGLLRLQLAMLEELCDMHKIHYAEITGKLLIVAMIANLRSSHDTDQRLQQYLDWVPGLGVLGKSLSYPKRPQALTYAVGRVFQKHFEHGGNLLNFSTTENESRFSSAYSEAKFVLD